MGTERTRGQERKLRKIRIRCKVKGTSERPRLNIFKSHKNFMVQAIDDSDGKTVVSASTQEAEVKKLKTTGGNVVTAKAMGTLIAKRLLAKGVKRVVFDRGGHKYHGAVKALADTVRESGLEF